MRYVELKVKKGEKIKIRGDEFYILNVKGERWIYSEFEDGISDLIYFLAEKKFKPEDLFLTEVTMLKRKWRIKQVPWSEIVTQAIKIWKTRDNVK